MSERDTHFQGFAHLLFPEVSKLFFTLYARIEEHRSIEEIDSVEDEIKTLLAQRAYDLVYQGLDNADGRLGHVVHEGRKPIRVSMDSFPDLTAWPEQSEK